MPSAADLPDPGIKLGFPALQADSLPTELSEKPSQHQSNFTVLIFVSQELIGLVKPINLPNINPYQAKGTKHILSPSFSKMPLVGKGCFCFLFFCFNFNLSWLCQSLWLWITTNCGKCLKRWEYQTCLLRNLYAVQEATFRTGYGTTVEKAMAPHSSTLAWKIPWMDEPGGLQSMGSLRVEQDWVTSLSLFTFMHWRRKWQPTPVFLPGESQGRGSLVSFCLWGRTESDTTEVT